MHPPRCACALAAHQHDRSCGGVQQRQGLSAETDESVSLCARLLARKTLS
jgi:hypothetical protein